MGDITRKHKKFTRPRQLFNRGRIDEENILVEKYGLKNKKEIWKAKTKISSIRRRAKNLINDKNEEVRQKFFIKLNNMGFNIKEISDVLGLTEKDLFERRLQTFVVKKGFANTPKQARQLIVHKHIFVNGVIVNIPSFLITRDLENKIEIKSKVKKVSKTTEKDKEDEE